MNDFVHSRSIHNSLINRGMHLPIWYITVYYYVNNLHLNMAGVKCPLRVALSRVRLLWEFYRHFMNFTCFCLIVIGILILSQLYNSFFH